MKRSFMQFTVILLFISLCIFFVTCKENENITLLTFTVTFDSNGGSIVDNQIISENSKILKPIDPKKVWDNSGLYEGIPYYNFIGWFYNSIEWDFNTPVTEDIILIANWSSTSTSVILTGDNNILTESINYINSNIKNDGYTLFLNNNIEVDNDIVLNGILTIIGIYEQRIITYDNPNNDNPNNALTLGENSSLTIGNNIFFTESKPSNMFIRVRARSSLIMKTGSKITARIAVAHIENESRFIMEGGEISSSFMGVMRRGDNTFEINEGKIIGNEFDIALIGGSLTDDSFILSNNAEVGNIYLLESNSNYTILNISSDWVGKINSINLIKQSSSINDVIDFWENKIIIKCNNLNLMDVNKFPLGYFFDDYAWSQNNKQLISNSSKLELVTTNNIFKLVKN